MSAGVCCTVILRRVAEHRDGPDLVKFSGQSRMAHSHLSMDVPSHPPSPSCKCSLNCQSTAPLAGLHRVEMPDSMRENSRDRIKRNCCDLNALVILNLPNRLVPLLQIILELGFLQRPLLYPSSFLLLQFDLVATCPASISIFVPNPSVAGIHLCERLQPDHQRRIVKSATTIGRAIANFRAHTDTQYQSIQHISYCLPHPTGRQLTEEAITIDLPVPQYKSLRDLRASVAYSTIPCMPLLEVCCSRWDID